MLRASWFYILIAAVVGAGGWYYYAHHQAVVIQVPTPPVTQDAGSVVSSKQSDEDLNRKRKEGIGSIKDLKTVPIDPGQNNGK